MKVLTSIAFFRGSTRRYETPLVEVDSARSPRRATRPSSSSPSPRRSLKPGLYTCQVNVIDDVAGTFSFPRLALLVRQ